MSNVKKLINFVLPEYEDELEALEEKNKCNKGSLFVCEAIRFYLMHKGKVRNESSETILRDIAREEVLKVLKNYKLAEKEEKKEEHEKVNAFDILSGDSFQENFEKFESDNS